MGQYHVLVFFVPSGLWLVGWCLFAGTVTIQVPDSVFSAAYMQAVCFLVSCLEPDALVG